jgi:hypothetical protein
MRLRAHLLTLSISVLLPVAAFAAKPRQHTATLRISHYAKTVELLHGDTVIDKGPLKTHLQYDIDSDEELNVVVRETNPLLFTYKWEAGTPTDTANFTAIKKFADAIKGAGDLLKPFARKEGQNQNVAFDGGSNKVLEEHGITQDFIDEFVGNAVNLGDFAAGIPADVKRSAGSFKAAEAVREKISEKKIPETIEALRKQLETVRKAAIPILKSFRSPKKNSLLTNRRELARVASLAPLALVELEAYALDAPPATKEEMAAQMKKTNQQVDDLAPSPGKPPGTTPAPAGGVQPAAPIDANAIAASSSLFDAFVALSLAADDIEDTIDEVEKYIAVASKIGEPEQYGPVKFNPTQNQPFELEIKAVAENAKIVETAKLPTGKYEVIVGPDDPADFEFDLAGVYSFVETERYEARTADGVTTIARSDSGDAVNGLTGAPMLTIIPRPWNDPSLVRGFQIGFSPVKDELGIFAGGILRFFDRVGIGAGIAYQQAERLDSGLTVGQTIPNADALKTHTLFKPGLYITLSVKVMD